MNKEYIKKEHYKMYKAGKRWIYAAVAAFSLTGVGASVASNSDFGHLFPLNSVMDTIGWHSVSADDTDVTKPQAFTNNGYPVYSDPSQITFTNKREATVGKWVNIGPIDSFVKNSKGNDQHVNFAIVGAYARADANGNPYITIAIGTTQLAGQSIGTRNSFYGYASNGSAKTFQYQYPKEGVWAYIKTTDLDSSYNQIGLQFTANNGVGGSDGDKHNALMAAKVQTQTNDSLNGDIATATAKVKAAETETDKMMDLLKAEQTKIDNAIDADPTLTSTEKTNQKALIPPMLTEAKAKMDYEVDTATIDSIEQSYIPKIDAAHTQGTPLADQKTAAKKVVDNKANAQVTAIKANNDMTDAEQTAAIKKVTDAQTTMDNNIDNATDADHVNSSRDDSTQNAIIENANQAAMTLAARQAAAKSQLETDKTNAENEIDGDVTLTSSEKTQRKAAIESAVSSAEATIASATKAQQVVDALNAAETTITNEQVHGTDLDVQKTTAKQSVSDYADQIKQQIAADNTLTTAEKNQQTRNVDQAVVNIQKQIADAANADMVNKYRDDGKNAIKEMYQPGTALSDQKTNAKGKVDAEATTVKAAIKADSTLTTDEKDAQTAAVESDRQKADQNIDNATNADGVNTARDNGIAAIDADHQSGKSTDEQKTAQKANVDAEAKKVSTAVNADNTLTIDEKNAQLAAVEADRKSADANIDNASDADGINSAASAGIATIDADHKPGKSTDVQKTTQKANVDAEAQKVSNAINADNTLTTDEKNAQTAAVEADRKAADENIDNASDADGINAAASAGITKIDADQQPGKSTDDQKTTQKGNVDAEAKKVSTAINADNTLTTDEKNAQLAAVEADRKSADQNIDNASNADGINSAASAGITKIDADHKPGKSTDDQKTTQKANVDAEAQKVSTAINADNTLTTDEKNVQLAAVEADRKTADANIDNASNADGINSATSDGIQKIDADHKPGKSTDDQKTAQKANVDAEAKKISTAINADNTLTTDEKNAQLAAVEADRKSANQNIDNASNADGINSAASAGITKIDADHKPGKSTDDQKTTQKANVDAEAQKVSTAIKADNTLTTDEKNVQLAAVETDRQTADKNIDNASNADAINSAASAGITKIDADHKPGTSTDDQKTTQKGNVDAEAQKVSTAIKADNTLTTDEKNAQLAAVETDRQTADNNIDNASNADGINSAASAGITKIDADHKPGTSTDVQKTTQKANVDAEAEKVIKAIKADTTLTTDEKNSQVGRVQTDQTQADQKIDDASDADGINAAALAGIQKIDADHVSGKATDDQKTTQKANVDAEAKKVDAAIQADNTLTTNEKNVQSAAVEADRKAADENIDNASDADGINSAASDGIQKIDADHKPGTSTDDQKKAQKANVDAEAKKVDAAINADNTLTTDEKKAQSETVEADRKAADENIDNAADADGINAAASAGIQKIDADHQSGKSTDDQKTAHKSNVDAEAKKVSAAINADTTLTTDEKKTQTAAVEADHKAADENIDNATDADGINAAASAGIQKIDADHKPGKSTDDQKTDQKANVDAEAKKVSAAITSDNTLTTGEKATQTAAVEADRKAADENIDNAADADAINAAASAGIQKIDADHKPGTSTDDQKTAQKANVDAEAEKVIKAIKADTTLTNEEKNSQVGQVQADQTQADQNIDHSSDADGINAAASAGIQKIDADHKPGKSTDDQKTAQKANVDAEAKKVDAAIKADNTLTTDEKNAQSEAVEADRKAADENIDNASDADGINAATTTGITKIDADHKPGTSTDDQKIAQKANVDAEAKKVTNAINADATLTTEEKSTQTAAVEADRKAADENIDNASDADGINAATTTGITKIDADHKPGTSTDDQKIAQKANVDAEAKKVTNAINADTTLTSGEKATQTAAVEADRKAADENIDNAADADGINAATTTGITKIDADHKPGTSTDDQKIAQKANVDAEAKKVTNAINADTTLTSGEKATQTAAVEADRKAADENIDNAADADGINVAASAGITKIDADHKPGKSTDDQKTNQKANVDAEAKKVTNAINADTTLTTDEKATQTAAVENDRKAADENIDNAADADGINATASAGIAKIDADHKSGKSTDDQKTAQKANVDAEAKKVTNAINADTTLTTDEKATQTAAVESDRKAADGNIDNAVDADAINAATTAGIQKIDADHKPGTSTDDQKTAQKANVDAEAKKVTNAINADTTLTTDEKSTQTAAVEADRKAADENIDNAADADAINAATSTGIAKIDADHKPGTPTDDQKTTQKGNVDAEAKKVSAAINADTTLTTNEKATQTAAVEADRKSADENIDNASDADGINAATSAGIAKIDADHKPGTAVNEQQNTAKGNVDAEAQKVINAINADNTLTSSAKSAQVDNVKAHQTTADHNIDAAQDADGINSAEKIGIETIDADHVSGRSISDQQSKAKQDLAIEAQTVINAINADTSLTGAEKTDQVNRVKADWQSADNKIDQDSTADTINSDFDSGKATIDADHTPGTPVETQKQNKKNDLDNEAQSLIQKINADVTLSSHSKQSQIAKVNADKQKADDNIDNASDADGINSAYADGKAAIDSDYTPGQPLPDQKKTQNSNLASEAQRIIDAINADNTLTSDAKTKQIGQVNADLTTAQGKINQATDQDVVSEAFTDGKATIDNDHVPGASLDSQRQAAKDTVATEAEKVINTINADNTLTSDEKEAQVNQVKADQQNADNKIDGATNADDINQSRDNGLTTIDAEHKAGVDLETQRQKAKQIVDDKAQSLTNSIKNDNTLTGVQKNEQVAKVEADQQVADTAIAQATNADGINSGRDSGLSKMTADYQTGTALVAQKVAAKQVVDAEATKEINKIKADNTLTTGKKNQQIASVQSDQTAADNAIDQSTDADGVNNQRNSGVQFIDTEYQPGTPLATQKQDAKDNVDAEAAKVIDAINADNTLTTLVKSKQVANVTADQTAADNAIDQAANADDINSARDNGIQKIDADHVSGQPLTDSKAAQKQSLETEATTVINAINSDTTLTSDAKTQQVNKVKADLATGEGNIDRAANQDAIDSAFDNGMQAIDGDHVPGDSLLNQKSSAKSAVDAEAERKIDAINSDNSLTAAEKKAQKDAVTTDQSAADQKIDQAKNADEIVSAKTAGLQKIDADYQTGTPVATQKQNAKDRVDAEAEKVVNAIKADNTLTTQEKQTQIDKVNADKTAADNAIDAATQADDINSARDQGLQKIDADHVAGTSLAQQKQTQKTNLEQEAQKVIAAIKSDNSLTGENQQSQVNKVNADLTAADTAIEQSNDADEVNANFNSGKAKIDSEHQPGTPLATQKQDAKDKVDAEAQKVINEINGDNSLLSEQKAAQIAQVNQDKTTADNAISQATNADGVNTAYANGIHAIDSDHKSGKALPDQKKDQKANLSAEATRVIDEIKSDPTLTTNDKNAQISQVNADLEAANKKIDEATDGDGVTAAMTAGKTTIDGDYHPGQALADQKKAAKGDVNDEATKVIASINADNSLTAEQKSKQVENVKADQKSANEAIDNASDADGVNSAKATGIQKMDADHVPGTPVATQKQQAKDNVDAEANRVIAAIKADTTLTAAEKQQQTDQVTSDKESADQAIDAATDADIINNAESTGIQKIDADHKPGTSTDGQKTTQKGNVDAEAKKVSAAIKADTTLTTDEKNAQLAAVENDRKTADDNIDKAADADTINAATSTGIAKIDADHKPGTPTDSQKTAQKGNVDAEAKKVSAAIKADTTLTTDEKNVQLAAVENDRKSADDNIDNASDADAINAATATGIAKIDADHKPGTSTDGQKTTQKGNVDAEAKKVSDAIKSDTTLTTDEKNAQLEKVEADRIKANQNIDNAADADAINAAEANGKVAIDADHVPGTPTDDYKKDQKSNVDDEAKRVSDAIKADNTLTTDEKNAQLAEVESDRVKANQNIDNAADADAVNQAVAAGKSAIDADHKPGISTDGQKTAQKGKVDAEAKKVSAAIKADTTLTADEKNAQLAAVENDRKSADDNIDNASDADGINVATATGIAKIDADHKPGISTDGQKTTQKGNVDAEAKKVSEAIKVDTTLTTDEKNSQLAAVENDRKSADENIDNASDADGINVATATGIAKIDADHKPGTSTDGQKTTQKGNVDAEAKKVSDAIKADTTLTTDEKNAQLAAVENDRKSADENIDNASDADAINAATATGIAKIDADHKPGTSTDGQKTTQKGNVDAEAKKVSAAIKADTTLTADEKNAQLAAVENDRKSADDNIDKAVDSDAINAATTAGIQKIDADHVPGTPKDGQKTTQKGNVDAEAKKVSAAIKADTTLTANEKSQQLAAVEADRKAADDNIETATDADSINAATKAGIQKIDADHVPGTPTGEQKTTQKGNVDAEAKKVSAAIKADTTLTTTEKATQLAAVENDRKSADDNIDKAVDADTINAATTAGIQKIDADHVAGTPTDNQKTTQKGNVDAEAKKVSDAIKADTTLTTDEKNAQLAKVETDRQAANDNIDKAADSDAINAATAAGIQKIDADHVPGTPTVNQKTTQKGNVDAEAKKVSAAIKADTTLTTDEKNAQLAKVETDRQAANDNIDKATDSDAINAATAAGIKKIDADHVAGTPTDNQKTTQKGNVDAEAKKVSAAIKADTTLTTDEKNAQLAKVEADRKAADDNIDKAADADDINSATSTGVAKIDADHKPGISTNGQKTTQKGNVDAEAKKVSDAIKADTTLTTDEKNAQLAKVEADRQAANDNIDKAADSDAINAATAAGIQKIDTDYQPGSLDDVKNQNKKNIDNAAAKAKQVVDDDGSLTPDDKNKRKAAIDQAAAKAKAAVDNGQNADDSDKSAKAGEQLIAGLNDAKNAADATINHASDQEKSDIKNDASLSTKQKNAQDAQVDEAAAAAKSAIDGATDLDDLNQATQAGVKAIEQVHQSATPLSQQKHDAENALNQDADRVKAEIEQDSNLTNAEKQEQLAHLNAVLQQMKQAIENASDSDSLEKALTTGKEAIEACYQKGVQKPRATAVAPKVEERPVVKDGGLPKTASRVKRNATQQTVGLALAASLTTFFLAKKRHDK